MRLFVSAVVCLGLGAGLARAGEVVESIVCKVNGDIITRSEIEKKKKEIAAEIAARGMKGAEADKVYKEMLPHILREKIDELLLIQKAKESSLNVDNEVSRWVADIQKRSGIADPEKFAASVREQTGQSLEDYRNQIKNNMLMQRIIGQEVQSKISLPRAEIEKYYEEHKAQFVRDEQVFLRELFISTDGKTPAERVKLEAKAKDVVARARRGERFTDLVRDNSDAQSKEQGGDIGGFKQGQLDKAIEDLVWDKQRNFVTDPIKRTSPDGWLILRVEDHLRAGQATLDEAENEIKNILYTPLFQPEMRKFLTRLRTEAFMEIREGWVDTGAASGQDTRWQDPAVLRPQTVSKEEVAEQVHLKRMFWLIPIPGTTTATTGKSSSR